MTGTNSRHYDRCDQGGGTEVRSEQKMGRLGRWPKWDSAWVQIREHPSSGIRQVLKHSMNRKRRQRDRKQLD